MPRHIRPQGALKRTLIPVVVGSLVLSLTVAAPAIAVDYPSWEDVQAARQNEASTKSAISEIESLLVNLESEAASLGREAQIKGEVYNIANAALQAAASRADKLDARAAEAEQKAELSIRKAGQLVAQLARTGGGDLGLNLMLSASPDDLLSSLGTVTKLTEQSNDIYRQAITDQNTASSLADQAQVAETERTTLANEADAAFGAAQASSDAALARLTEQQAASAQLYDQLASLKGTTADIERRYLEGTTPPPTTPAPSNPGTGNPGTGNPGTGNPGTGNPSTPTNPTQPTQPTQPTPPTPVTPTPPAPNPSAAQGAINFARSQLGDWYQFAGAGPDRWDCSGLTMMAYRSVGVYIGGHGATDQYWAMANAGRLVSRSQWQPGDLVFYAENNNPYNGVYHVGLYIGGGQMIEAPKPGVQVRVKDVYTWDILNVVGRPTG